MVLWVNMHWLIESEFWYDIILSRYAYAICQCQLWTCCRQSTAGHSGGWPAFVCSQFTVDGFSLILIHRPPVLDMLVHWHLFKQFFFILKIWLVILCGSTILYSVFMQNRFDKVVYYVMLSCSMLTETKWDRNYLILLQSQLEALRTDIGRVTEDRNGLLAELSLLQKTCAGCRQCATQSADCRLSVVHSCVLCCFEPTV